MVNVWRAAGIIPVFAAGNNGLEEDSSLDTVANLPNVIAVGSVDLDNVIRPTSSRGKVQRWWRNQHVKPDFATVGLFTPYEGNVYKGLQNDMADLIEKVDDETGDKYYHNANIESTWEFPEGYSKHAIQKNFYDEGTSYAAPRLSGIIALLLSPDPTLTYVQIYEALKTTNTPNHDTGYGVVNAVEALEKTR